MNESTTTTGAARTAAASPLIASNQVEGTAVFDPSGKHIGSIKRLVIEKVSGRVVYTVASFGGFLGLGSNDYTIPWNRLSYDVGLGGFLTDITETQLKGSPAFSQDRDWDFTDREHERALNDYYDSPYYWR
jgi:sporulation protein YlmC with PRC-barrel domain